MGSVQCPPKVTLSVAHRQAHIFLCLADFRNQTALVEVMADPLKSNRLVYCSRKMTRQWLWSFTLSGSTLGHLWSIARIHRCCLTKHCKSKALWVRQHSLAHLVLLTYAALCCIQDLPVSVGERALEGVTRMRCATDGGYLQNLPSSLEHLISAIVTLVTTVNWTRT